MKVSLNTVKRYTAVELSIDELVARVNAQLGGVEEVTDLGVRYKDARIVKVIECGTHPDADRLHVCKVDDGGAVADIERDEQGLVQVVCGAPNVHAGMFAVWLPPGSTVPASYTDKEPFILGARELRGVMSYGMLASPQELGLGDSHDGLLELDPEEPLPDDAVLKPGASFAQIFGLDDTVIEIENKMFTHRPDCFGQLGVARELAGIQHIPFVSPGWYSSSPAIEEGEGLTLAVTNDAADKTPRFMAVALKNVTVGPSPVWLQSELIRLGGKPINNIVDVTNYLMLLTGQPLHAYDYDKLAGGHLGVRHANKGEHVRLLNGKNYELTTDDIVIVDANGPVGLGGVMGGGDSEVSADTKNIVLEAATFDMYAIRKTSMRHGLFTDAVTRFNKGQSSLQNDRVLALAVTTVIDAAGGRVGSPVYDEGAPRKHPEPVHVSASFINERLGLDLSADDIRALLENVECAVEIGDELVITPPFWRTDISIAEDVVEEVGRLYGFDKLPRVLPSRSTKPAPKNIGREAKQRIRESLSRAGANEALTYSFVHEKIIQRADQDVSEAFQLSNALSPDLQYYRLSVLPSLLDKVHPNIKAGHDEFALFEIGKGHNKKLHLDDDAGLPAEMELIDMVYTSKKAKQGAAYYKAQRLVSQLLADMNLANVVLKPVLDATDDAVMAPFDHSRSALIETQDGEYLGIIGELTSKVVKNFKLPAYTAAASLDFQSLSRALAEASKPYVPLSRYPKVSQDVSLKVPMKVTFATLYDITTQVFAKSELGETSVVVIEPRAIYQPSDGTTKTITLHIEVTSYQQTLTDQAMTNVLDEVVDRASRELKAERV